MNPGTRTQVKSAKFGNGNFLLRTKTAHKQPKSVVDSASQFVSEFKTVCIQKGARFKSVDSASQFSSEFSNACTQKGAQFNSVDLATQTVPVDCDCQLVKTMCCYTIDVGTNTDSSIQSQSEIGRGLRRESASSGLQKQLEEKQAELIRLQKEFDETRCKVFELNQKVKEYENRPKQPETSEQVEPQTYDLELQRYSQEIEAVNAGLHKRVQESNSERDAVTEVAEELRNRFLAESQQLTELRREHSEFQANLATLRLAQIRDRSHSDSLQRQLEEAQRGRRRANEAAELAQKELDEARLETQRLNAECRAKKLGQLEAASKVDSSTECGLLAKHRATKKN